MRKPTFLLVAMGVALLAGSAWAADAEFRITHPDGRRQDVQRQAVPGIVRDFVHGRRDGRLVLENDKSRWSAWIDKKGAGFTFHGLRSKEDVRVQGADQAWRLFEELDAAEKIATCEWNLKNFAFALDVWRDDHGGRYPPALASLNPDYLRTAPTCPTTGTDTYAAGYQPSQVLDAYTLTCTGRQPPAHAAERLRRVSAPVPTDSSPHPPHSSPTPPMQGLPDTSVWTSAIRVTKSPPAPPMQDPYRGLPTTPEAAKVVEVVRQRMASMKSYEMSIEVKHRLGEKEMVASSRLAWLAPRFLLIESTFDTTLSTKMVFDGTWQWSENKDTRTGRIEAVKVRLDKATRPAKPFDSYWYVYGAGLSPGGDYRSTILDALGIYRFRLLCKEMKDGSQCTVLEGSLDEPAALAADPQLAALPESMQAQFLNPSRRCRLWVTAEGLVTRTMTGRLEEFRDHRPTVVDYLRIRVDPPLTPELFQYRPPSSITVKDITDEVVKARRREQP